MIDDNLDSTSLTTCVNDYIDGPFGSKDALRYVSESNINQCL